MKHAGAATLALLEPLLRELRMRSSLRERTPGSFYLGSKGFLHFHEDPAGLFADVKLNGLTFERLQVTTASDRSELLRRIDLALEARRRG